MILPLLLAVSFGGFIPDPAVRYVSASGSDSNPGTMSAPWQTVAKVNASTTTGKTVYFNGGDTFAGTALALHSSTNYASYGTGRAIISGGVAITTWTQVDVPNTIWRATWNAGRPRSLYVNGIRVKRARQTSGLPSGSTANSTTLSTAASVNPGFMSTWGNKGDIELVLSVEWRNAYVPISTIVGNTITPIAAWAQLYSTENFNGFTTLPTAIENAYEIFTANNEVGTFYQDRTAGFVYMIPPVATPNPNSATVIAPVLEQLLTGSSVTTCTVTNLEFQYTTNLDINTNGFAEIQGNTLGDNNTAMNTWTHPKSALSLSNCTNVTITLCLAQHLGAAGIGVENVSTGCTIIGNIIGDVSGSGVQIGGLAQNVGTCPVSTTISNNYIAYCGQEFQGAVGAMQWWCNTTTATHNEVKKLPYSGIAFGLGWGFEPIPSGTTNTSITFNLVHDVNLVQNDGACIYVNSRQPSSVITSNYGYNSGQGRSWGGPNSANFNGIYLDDASQGWTVQNNVLVAIGSKYFFCNDNIDSNVFITNTTDGGSYVATPGFWTAAPNTYDTLLVVSTATAQAAGVATGAGLQVAYAAVKTEGDSLFP